MAFIAEQRVCFYALIVTMLHHKKKDSYIFFFRVSGICVCIQLFLQCIIKELESYLVASNGEFLKFRNYAGIYF